MAYAIMKIDKIKSAGDMASRYKHNFRIFNVANADRRKTGDNIEAVDCNGHTYEELYEEEITRTRSVGSSQRAIRSDAVKAIEVMLSYSYENDGNIPLQEWIDKNVEWLQKTFNPPDRKMTFKDYRTGEIKTEETDNVKSVIVHMDESVPHIHAFIIPIDDRGHLNARYYCGERSRMREMQDSYGHEMEAFGLKRGEVRSTATSIQIAKFHDELQKAVDAELPFPEKDEDVFAYRERANEVYKRERIHHQNDLVNLRNGISKDLSVDLRERAEFQKETDMFGRQLSAIARELDIDEITPGAVRQMRRDVRETEQLKKGLDEYPDRDLAESVRTNMQVILEWEKEKERRERMRDSLQKEESSKNI